ncbi:MAG: hypothetical protein NTX66_01280, partial [Candidatus Falkowbacteria bacterium]|nr:hypothetical protein [Candidatus Falkowbacteria bacterium]
FHGSIVSFHGLIVKVLIQKCIPIILVQRANGVNQEIAERIKAILHKIIAIIRKIKSPVI